MELHWIAGQCQIGRQWSIPQNSWGIQHTLLALEIKISRKWYTVGFTIFGIKNILKLFFHPTGIVELPQFQFRGPQFPEGLGTLVGCCHRSFASFQLELWFFCRLLVD